MKDLKPSTRKLFMDIWNAPVPEIVLPVLIPAPQPNFQHPSDDEMIESESIDVEKKLFTVSEINKLIKSNDCGFELKKDSSSTFYTANNIELVGRSLMVNCSYFDSPLKLNDCKILVLKSNGWRAVRVSRKA
jgi:hypothetical protein